MSEKNTVTTCHQSDYAKRFWLIGRRVLFFGSTILLSLISVLWLVDYLWSQGFSKATFALVFVFFILNSLLILGSFHAFFGFLDVIRGKQKSARITSLIEGMTGNLDKRYAVVMPIYNEDSSKVCARIEAMYQSIKNTGHIQSFDFYLLSDTRNADLWVLEEVAWTNLCQKLQAFGRIHYRRRVKNENRKAGNIGDFVRTWGGAYEGMLVLDADSLMEGNDILKMARVMEVYPNLGILQTVPKLIRGTSVISRMQQFAMRLYGPLFVRGLNYWQLNSGSYWGHNAMIRVKPFSEFCELPALPGREPFGGKILSHDFVEAALMVSEGWEVWLAWDIEGTYEESPPTLMDHLKRDRRWCQGNLQHLWLLFARKLKLPVRVHLFMGIMAYLSGPLWFVFLWLSTWLAWDFKESRLSSINIPSYAHRYFDISTGQQQGILAVFVLILLFAPKMLALCLTLISKRKRQNFGGGLKLLAGVFLENVISILLAPSMMISHTLMVLGIVLGRSVGWGTQNRETDGSSWKEASMFHAVTTLVGLFWTYIAIRHGGHFLIWMSPILIGLVFSIPVSVWTSRSRYGAALKHQGLFLSQSEIKIPQIIDLADQAEESSMQILNASQPKRYGFIAAVVDPFVNGLHVSLLTHPKEMDEDEAMLVERCLEEGKHALNQDQINRLMYSSGAMLALHRSVWLRVSETIHHSWQEAVVSYRRPRTL